jgi:hypothetical protein
VLLPAPRKGGFRKGLPDTSHLLWVRVEWQGDIGEGQVLVELE